MDKARTQDRRWLIQFAVISLLPIALIGIYLGFSFRADIRERALDNATEEAELVARVALDGQVAGTDLDKGLQQGQVAALDAALAEIPTENEISRVNVRNRAYKVVYSPDKSMIGRQDPASKDLQRALEGRRVWKVMGEGPNAVLKVYVPLHSTSGESAGTSELTMPFGPIAKQIGRDARGVWFTLFVALAALYAMLFAVVSGASQTLRRRATDKEHESRRDVLTGLPNRASFRDQVVRACKQAQRKKRLVAVMVMDLDRFKEINDTLGHFHGDLVLQRVGSRIQGVMRGNETVARMGGDEFAILLPDIEDPSAARKVAKRILKTFEDPISVSGLSLQVEASIGIAMFPKHGDSVDALLRAGDVAMYVAKEERTGFEYYAAEEHRHDASSLALIGEMRRAMDSGELVLFYQPKADLQTGEVHSVEALARWQHPGRGMLSPDEFIPLAEHSSLLRPVTLYLLETAIRQCRAWQNQGFELSVAVNLSVVNLLDTQLPTDLAHLLSEARLDPGKLELEITESTIMKDPRRAMQILTRLSEMGISLSVDDFGTGYSSLAYLKQLPVSTIKIDKSFVMTMSEDEGNATIVNSTIDLGHNLGLTVVAEGVENEDIYDHLADAGCDYAQGYFLSRPLPPDKLAIWLEVYSKPLEELQQTAPQGPSSDEDAQLQEWIVA